jgi:hypothetical protein
MTKNILADFHHEDLYQSLHNLFVKRLGWNLYRPIGMEWHEEDFWMVFNHPATARQYLDPVAVSADRIGIDGSIMSNLQEGAAAIEKGIYHVPSTLHTTTINKAISLPRFKETKFDIILCSNTNHIQRFRRLRDQFQPQAKLIMQVGNNWNLKGIGTHTWNILNSTKASRVHPNSHSVFYHQEFDAPAFSINDTKINPRTLSSMTHYQQEKEYFFDLERRLSNWTFKAYGAGNRDNSINPPFQNIIDAFKRTGFVMHIKPQGDGYGYNQFYAAASGTPLVLRKSHFKGMTSDDLWTDGETCIDIDGKSMELIVDLLEKATSDYPAWRQRVLTRFRQVVNFDAEFEQIKIFLHNLR